MKAQDQGQSIRYLATRVQTKASVKHGIQVNRSTPLQVRLRVEGLSPRPARVRIVAKAICRRELERPLLTRIVAARVTIGLERSREESIKLGGSRWEGRWEMVKLGVALFFVGIPSTIISYGEMKTLIVRRTRPLISIPGRNNKTKRIKTWLLPFLYILLMIRLLIWNLQHNIFDCFNSGTHLRWRDGIMASPL